MNIAVVGAGNGGKNIIDSLSGINDVNISLVIDTNLNAPGIELAKKLGIRCSTSIDDISPSAIDLVIEVTGSEKVVALLKERLGEKVKLIDSAAARLIVNLVQRDLERIGSINKQVDIINMTSGTVQSKINEISNSIENIHYVIERLAHFTRLTDEYILQMDRIIEFVNSVAMQTKVLGINATIEAMRAGESGRTFSIVAKEIQGLANDSEENSKGIKEILSKLSEEIKKVNGDVDNLKDMSRIQMDAAEGMNAALDSLLKETGKIT